MKTQPKIIQADAKSQVNSNEMSEIENHDITFKESLSIHGDYEVFFSKDPKYLNQYYKARFDAYRQENGWDEFNAMETRFDRDGKILIIAKGEEFVGGLRLMISRDCPFMSHELPGTQYDYRKFIRKYDEREELVFSEIAAVVVKKDLRDPVITQAMLGLALNESKRQGCSYSFAVAMLIASRHYRKLLSNLGYDLEIVINFPWDRKKTYGNFATLIYTKLD